MADPSDSPFAALEATFRLLTTGPEPLTLDGRLVGPPLPPRRIPLGELRDLMLQPRVPLRVRNAAVGVLLDRAKADGGAATVALAGVLLPGLRKLTAPRKGALPSRSADIEAEAIAGLLEGVCEFEAGKKRDPLKELFAASLRRVDRLVGRELTIRARHNADELPDLPSLPFGHPDLVLVAAVQDGAVCADDAFVIGETRLGGVSLAEVARMLQISPETLQKRRRRAEEALVAWLQTGFVRNRLPRTLNRDAGRPRRGRRLAELAHADHRTPEEVTRHPSGQPCGGGAGPTTPMRRGGNNPATERGHRSGRCDVQSEARARRAGGEGRRLRGCGRLPCPGCDRDPGGCRRQHSEPERRDLESP